MSEFKLINLLPHNLQWVFFLTVKIATEEKISSNILLHEYISARVPALYNPPHAQMCVRHVSKIIKVG